MVKTIRAEIVASRIFRSHLAVIFVLTFAHSALYLLVPTDGFGYGGALGLLDMQQEQSLATVVSALALLAAAICAATLAAANRGSAQRLGLAWSFVALCLAFMAIDEACALHDRLADHGQEALGTQGAFLIGWTLPYLFLAAAVGGAGLTLLRSIPAQTRNRLIVAGGLYVLFALGFEMAEGLLLQHQGGAGAGFVEAMAMGPPPFWNLLVTIEEAGEMLAVAAAIRALLLHMGEDLHLSFAVTRHG